MRDRKDRRYGVVLVAAFGAAIVWSGCQRIPQPPAFASIETGIPARYGRFVGATPIGSGAWSTLWFEQADQTIVAVNVQAEKGLIASGELTISRK